MPVAKLYRFSELRPALSRHAQAFFFKSPPQLRQSVIDFVLRRLPANVFYSEVNDRFIADISQITGLKVVLIRRGDILARGGQVIDSRAHDAIRAAKASTTRRSWTVRYAARCSLIAALLLMFVLAAETICPWSFRNLKAYGLVHGAFLLIVILGKLALLHWPVHSAVLPHAAVALIVAVVLGREPSVLSAIAIGSGIGLAFHFDLSALLVGAGGGAVAALATPKRRKSGVLSTGIIVGVVQALIFEAARAGAGRPAAYTEHWSAAQAFAGGLLSGLLALLALPFVQRWMGQASQGKLKVLGDLDHPLMRRLRERAPDVFAHSLRVANLAERAAEAVQADRVLTRVGAMFHDIGKVEQSTRNDPAQPESSAEHSRTARLRHVEVGTRLAQAHAVPAEVICFIQEHHGTMRDKADHDHGDHAAPSGELRFAGPRPTCLESAIVMIANAVDHESQRTNSRAETAEQCVERVLTELLVQFQFAGSGVTQTQLQQMRVALVAYIKSR